MHLLPSLSHLIQKIQATDTQDTMNQRSEEGKREVAIGNTGFSLCVSSECSQHLGFFPPPKHLHCSSRLVQASTMASSDFHLNAHHMRAGICECPTWALRFPTAIRVSAQQAESRWKMDQPNLLSPNPHPLLQLSMQQRGKCFPC